MNTQRLPYIDSLRGIAALIVVLSHYAAAFYPYSIYGLQGNYRQKALWEDIFFYPPFGVLVAGHFAVSLFFILSGYVLSYSFLGEHRRMDALLKAACKRPVRLGGLVLFTVLAGYGLWDAGWFYHQEIAELSGSAPWFSQYWQGDADSWKLIQDIGLSLFASGSTYNPPLWSIKVELYGSFLVFFFVAVWGASRHRLLILFFFLFLFHRGFYAGFILGMMAADIVKNHPRVISRISNRYVSIALFLLCVYFSSYPYCADADFFQQTWYALPVPKWVGRGFPLVGAFALFVMVVTNSRTQKYLTHRIWLFFGRISYSVYAVHFLVLGSVSSFLFLTLYPHFGYFLSFLMVLISGLAIIVVTAYAATIYIDEPAIRIASSVADHVVGFLKSIRIFDSAGPPPSLPPLGGGVYSCTEIRPCASPEEND
jgi:peptidoglycan/LPS O-acetylase OafA/YrhL